MNISLRNNKKILAIVAIIIAGFFIYIITNSSDDFEQASIANTDLDPALFNDEYSVSGEVARSEAYFLEQIRNLQQVTLDDVSVLKDNRLQKLDDNTVVIPEFARGRSNPFSPIEARVQFENSQVNDGE